MPKSRPVPIRPTIKDTVLLMRYGTVTPGPDRKIFSDYSSIAAATRTSSKFVSAVILEAEYSLAAQETQGALDSTAINNTLNSMNTLAHKHEALTQLCHPDTLRQDAGKLLVDRAAEATRKNGFVTVSQPEISAMFKANKIKHDDASRQ